MTLAERPNPVFQPDEILPVPAEVVDWTPSSPLSSAQSPPQRDTTVQPYNPERIRQQHEGQWWLVTRRWLAILWPFARFVFNQWWDRKTDQVKANEHLRAVELRETLTRLGPAFIKIGQALSTRPDVLSSGFLEEMSKLQDQIPPFDNEVAHRFIEEELGAPYNEVFTELSPNPIAAASLGQVYKGRLKTGEAVAVKVQRPDLAEQIALDIYIIRGLAVWAQKTFKGIRSDLPAILDEFAGRLFEEMDYIREGHNSERFIKLYGFLDDIYVPKIYWEYTNTRVLTMEWITGIKLNQPEKILAQGIDASYLVDVGIQCSLRQLLEHGFFHADPHPGNLLAMPNGKLAYLDFGMMSEINVEQRYGLLLAIVHIVNREFESLASDYVRLGFLSPEVNIEPIVPALSMVFDNALGASVAELNIQRIFEQLSEVMYEYPFKVPAYYALIVRSLLTMEGIAMGVDPNFKVLSAAYPYVAKRLLTDDSPELRASLKELLFKDESFRWNRLENLLNNARNISDYDLGDALHQGIDFLFSERGDFIRDRLADELVKTLDQLGRSSLQSFVSQLGGRTENLGSRTLASPQPAGLSITPSAPGSQNLAHMQRIWSLLQDTPGFDSSELVPVLINLLTRRQTHELGFRVASGLMQKTAARLIREWLVPNPPAPSNQNRTAIVAKP